MLGSEQHLPHLRTKNLQKKTEFGHKAWHILCGPSEATKDCVRTCQDWILLGGLGDHLVGHFSQTWLTFLYVS